MHRLNSRSDRLVFQTDRRVSVPERPITRSMEGKPFVHTGEVKPRYWAGQTPMLGRSPTSAGEKRSPCRQNMKYGPLPPHAQPPISRPIWTLPRHLRRRCPAVFAFLAATMPFRALMLTAPFYKPFAGCVPLRFLHIWGQFPSHSYPKLPEPPRFAHCRKRLEPVGHIHHAVHPIAAAARIEVSRNRAIFALMPRDVVGESPCLFEI